MDISKERRMKIYCPLLLQLIICLCFKQIECSQAHPEIKSSSREMLYKKNFHFLLDKNLELEKEINSYHDEPNVEKKGFNENQRINNSRSCLNKTIPKLEWKTKFFKGSHDSLMTFKPGYSGSVNSLKGFPKLKVAHYNLFHSLNTLEWNTYLLGFSGNPFWIYERSMKEEKENPLKINTRDPRKKRSALHLYNMVLCATGCNPFTYKGYGCYCGFLGSGYAVDGIDSCCQMHDRCYYTAGCPTFLEYFIPYLWKCYSHQPLCVINYGSSPGSSGSCAQRLCECDRQLALCLRQYPCPRGKAFCTSSPWRLLQNVLTF